MYKKIFVLCQAAVSLAVREGVYKKLKDIFPDSQVKVPLVNSSDQLTKGTADVIMVLTQNNTPEDLRIATGAIPQLIEQARKFKKLPVAHITSDCVTCTTIEYVDEVELAGTPNGFSPVLPTLIKIDYENMFSTRNIRKRKEEEKEQEARVKAGWAAAADPALRGTPVPSRGLHIGRAERLAMNSHYGSWNAPAPLEWLTNGRPIPNGTGLNEQVTRDLRQVYATARKNITTPVDKTHAPDGIFRIDIYDGTEMLFDKNLMLLFR